MTLEKTGTQKSIFVLYLALITVQVLFGVNYVVSKIVVGAFPPLVWASIRIIIAAIVMVLTCILLKREPPKGGRAFFLPLVVFAMLGTVINQGSFLVGLHYTTPTNSAVLNTLIPIFTLLIVTIRGQEPATPKRIFGFAISFLGVLILRKVEDISLSDKTLIGDLLTVLNCFSYALFLSYGKKFTESHDRFWTTAWMFIYGSVGLTALAIPSYTTFHWPEIDSMLLGCMAFAILGGTLLTYFLNVWTLAQVPPSSVAIFIYLQPIIAAALAWSWLGQAPTLRTGLASGMIFVGVLLALSKKAPAPISAVAPLKV